MTKVNKVNMAEVNPLSLKETSSIPASLFLPLVTFLCPILAAV